MTTWREALMDSHPSLFCEKSDRGVYTPGFPATGDGWRDLLKQAVARIAAADVDRMVRIDQIKENSGACGSTGRARNP